MSASVHLSAPRFVEMPDGSFREAAAGVVCSTPTGPRLDLDGRCYRLVFDHEQTDFFTGKGPVQKWIPVAE